MVVHTASLIAIAAIVAVSALAASSADTHLTADAAKAVVQRWVDGTATDAEFSQALRVLGVSDKSLKEAIGDALRDAIRCNASFYDSWCDEFDPTYSEMTSNVLAMYDYRVSKWRQAQSVASANVQDHTNLDPYIRTIESTLAEKIAQRDGYRSEIARLGG